MGKHLLTPGHLAANATPNSVYRYFDHADRLIYIGVTARGIQRQQEHEKLSDWFDHADHQQIEKCPDRNSALTLERELIKAYRPPFNKVHNGDWEPIWAAYLGLVRAEKALAAAQAGEHVIGGGRCGHCPGCRAVATGDDGAWVTTCRLLTKLEPDEEAVTCPICKRADCFYEDGIQEGMGQGHADGRRSARWAFERQHAALLVTNNFLVDGVIDRQVTIGGGPFILEPPGVPDGPLRIKGSNLR